MRRYDHARCMEHERPAPRQRAALSLIASALLPALVAALADPAVALAAALPAAAVSRLA